MTFQSWVVFPSNSRATHAARRWALGGPPVLLLYGASGVGKSLLMQAALAGCAEANAAEVVYVSSGDVIAKRQRFPPRWRNVEALGVDDVHRLAGKRHVALAARACIAAMLDRGRVLVAATTDDSHDAERIFALLLRGIVTQPPVMIKVPRPTARELRVWDSLRRALREERLG